MSRIYISATRKSSGKTTFSLGLCAALSERGLVVQPFKKGPDYIDPMWLSKVSGRPCFNLDFNTMSRDELLVTFARYQKNADISVVEGTKGLFDGIDLKGADSNAAMAGLLQTPVILVLDAEGITRGIAPLLQGYQAFDRNIQIAGVVLNNLGGARHETKLRNVIEYYTDIEVLGAIQRNADLIIRQRHLGLTTEREDPERDRHIAKITEAVKNQVDIDRIIKISDMVNAFPVDPLPGSQSLKAGLRIGIARDDAFCFYYPDDLVAMEQLGVTIKYFDTMQDHALPDVDALFIGGGFPEMHGQQLQSNSELRAAIRQFVSTGKPVYAECGGLMYLSREINWQGRRYEMVGAIPADTELHQRPVGRGYVVLETTSDHPWISKPGQQWKFNGQVETQSSEQKPSTVNAHEFHYSSLRNVDSAVKYAFNVKRGHGIDGDHDGLVYGSIFASYSHMRNTAANPWVVQFIEAVKANIETNSQSGKLHHGS